MAHRTSSEAQRPSLPKAQPKGAEPHPVAEAPQPRRRPARDFSGLPLVQAKLAVGELEDPSEAEADRAAEQALSGGASPIRLSAPGGGAGREAPEAVGEVLASPGRPLDPRLRSDLEPRFGQDFSGVRLHTDGRAADSARAIDALAYTAGEHIVFGAGRFAPGTREGKRLLTHELAHVAQQGRAAGPIRRQPAPAAAPADILSVGGAMAALERARGLDLDSKDPKAALALVSQARAYLDATVTDAAIDATYGKSLASAAVAGGTLSNIKTVIGMAKGGVKSLETKLKIGQTGSKGTWDYELNWAKAGYEYMQMVERNGRPKATASDPNAIIPMADFVTYVEAVEKGYPKDTREQIVTRIRQLSYNGAPFDRLIPGATRKDGGVTRLPTEDKIGASAYKHLASHADENAVQDNPSPYVKLPNGEQADVGHLLLTLDALLHTTPPDEPYKTFNVPAIDPASWVADLGIAAVWMEQHEDAGSPPDGAPKKLAKPDLDAYYKMSAPAEDLIGDVDGFALHKVFELRPGMKLSEALRAYYLKGQPQIYTQARYKVFCEKNGLDYTQSGSSITWTFDRPKLIARIDRFNDLFGAGGGGAAWATLTGSVKHRTWRHTPAVLDKFLNWIKPKLEAELGASSKTP